MDIIVIGIDISKKKFDLALNYSGKKWLNRVFSNDIKGFDALLNWLGQNNISSATFALEATGRYGEDLSRFLYDRGFNVLVMNPAQVKYFGQSGLSRAKTDKKDARLIAEFATTHKTLRSWAPRPPAQEKLKNLYRCLVILKEDRVQQINRLEALQDKDVRKIITAQLNFITQQVTELENQIRGLIGSDSDLKGKVELLQTIPGVGEVVSWGVLCESPDIKNFVDARQLAAFAGLNPSIVQSSVRGRGSISKIGSASLRRLLYMPSLSAMRYNAHVKALADRLKDKGKNGKLIVIACMRKLLHIIFGVLKNQKPFIAG